MFLPIGDDVDNRSLSIIGILLILACTFVFIAELKTQAGRDKYTARHEIQRFVKTWGLVPKHLDEGRYVGLVSHVFLHADLLHILGNMVVLWAFANSLENYLGAGRFLSLFLFWGVAGGLAHAAMHWGEPRPLVGASGAIAGMIGAYWVAFGGLTRIKTLIWIITPRTIMIPTPLFIFIWVMTQVFGATDANGTGGIAWFCHLGGFAAGAMTMLLVRRISDVGMRLDPEGHLEFAHQAAASEVDHDALPPLETCPFCDEPLEGVAEATAGFVRCSNLKCQRTVFLDPTLSATL